jgi:hypothetical protein
MGLNRPKRELGLCLAALLAGVFAPAAQGATDMAHAASDPFGAVAHASGDAFGPVARAASNSPFTYVNEWGRLQKQSSKGYEIDEKGVGWGSFNCSVLIQMTLSGTLVTAGYTAYLQGGAIECAAIAHIHRASTEYGYFSGTITLRHGTGSRSGAAGTATFAGTINRTSYAMSTHIVGRLRL